MDAPTENAEAIDSELTGEVAEPTEEMENSEAEEDCSEVEDTFEEDLEQPEQ